MNADAGCYVGLKTLQNKPENNSIGDFITRLNTKKDVTTWKSNIYLFTRTFESHDETHERHEDGRDGEDGGSSQGEVERPAVHTHRAPGALQGSDARAVQLCPRHQHHQHSGGGEGKPPDVRCQRSRDEIIIKTLS